MKDPQSYNSKPQKDQQENFDALCCNSGKSITQGTVSIAQLVNQEIAATVLGVSPKWLERDRWAERRIPYIKIGRLVRYRASDIAAYIDANIQEAAQ